MCTFWTEKFCLRTLGFLGSSKATIAPRKKVYPPNVINVDNGEMPRLHQWLKRSEVISISLYSYLDNSAAFVVDSSLGTLDLGIHV